MDVCTKVAFIERSERVWTQRIVERSRINRDYQESRESKIVLIPQKRHRGLKVDSSTGESSDQVSRSSVGATAQATTRARSWQDQSGMCSRV